MIQKGSIVRLKEEKQRDLWFMKLGVGSEQYSFLVSNKEYTVEYFITYKDTIRVVFEEDEREYKYKLDWFEEVKKEEEEIGEIVRSLMDSYKVKPIKESKQKITIDDVLAKQDFIPKNIEDACEYLTYANGLDIALDMGDYESAKICADWLKENGK